MTGRGSTGSLSRRLGLCEDAVAFDLDAAVQWRGFLAEQESAGEREKRQIEMTAAMLGVKLG